MNETLISIITSSYNSSRFILDIYESIQSQTYKNWEWLIIDDCSADNSYSLIVEITSKAYSLIYPFYGKCFIQIR